MADAPDLNLDDYVDLPTADSLSDVFSQAKAVACVPRPTLREMIDEIGRQSDDIEDAQLRLLATGARTDPYAPYMRRAAVLAAAVNFLLMIDANKEAVKRALPKAR